MDPSAPAGVGRWAMKRIRTERILRAALCALLLGLGLCGTAVAADVAFTATVDGQAKSVSVDAFQADGEAYVSLEKLMRQFGGSTREAPGKATIDLGGRSVVVTLNGTRVSTSSDTFELGHPVKEADGGPYIAVSDLGKLFADAFKVSIAQAAPTAEVPDAPEDVEENMGLLESVATPATPPVPETPTSPEGTVPPTPTADAAEPPATPPSPNGAFVVVIDAGHGGSDTGIVAASGVAEKDIALRIALAVQAGLADAEGIHVVLTRAEDKDLSLVERASLATQAKGRLLLSIHTGGSTAATARGFEIFAPAGGSSTAGGVTASMSTESLALGKIAEQALATGTGAPSRGVRTASLRLQGAVPMAGLLVEVGILSTAAEEAELGSEAFAGKVAAALVDVVKQASARAKGGQ